VLGMGEDHSGGQQQYLATIAQPDAIKELWRRAMQNDVGEWFEVDKLRVLVSEGRKQVGEVSARLLNKKIHELLKEKEEIRIIFAAGQSQNELLAELANDRNIDWSRVVAFHMDEYVCLSPSSNEFFGKFLADCLFSKVKFKQVHFINRLQAGQDTLVECKRYEALLKEHGIDICCMGIGENGHIAFNDPHVANFEDPVFVKVVELDERCKRQQVNDGCFPSVDEVPPTAISLTIPALLSAKYITVVVPGIRKADAVRNTLYGDITTKCPASILRTHPAATLYLDKESASLLDRNL
jgi:glucosamine-6-phosphate deaminase